MLAYRTRVQTEEDLSASVVAAHRVARSGGDDSQAADDFEAQVEVEQKGVGFADFGFVEVAGAGLAMKRHSQLLEQTGAVASEIPTDV